MSLRLVKRPFIILMAVFLLAALLRFWNLENLPRNMHEDEVLVGYVGRYILQNGIDIYGNKLPLLYFDKFGDYYIIGPYYLSGLSTFLFGVNAFAVRFPAALLGSLIVFPVYGLVKELLGRPRHALFAALCVAILPWHIVLSRSSAEGVMGSTIFLTGFWMLLYSIKRLSLVPILVSCFMFLVSYWIYHPFRLYVPMVLVLTGLWYIRSLKSARGFLMISILILILFSTLTVSISQTNWGRGRFDQTSIFGSGSPVAGRMQELVFNDKNPSLLMVRIFHNKIIGYGHEFIAQYLSHTNPYYLFVRGWGQKFYVPEAGMLYHSLGVGLIGYILLAARARGAKRKPLLFLAGLGAMSIIPAAMTVIDSPNLHRATLWGILLAVLAGIGLSRIAASKRLFALITISIGLEVLFFSYMYVTHFDFVNSLYRQDANKSMSAHLSKLLTQETGDIFAPSETTFALYHLFYQNDFNPSYSAAFGAGARIDRIRRVRFVHDTSCATDPRVFALAKPGDILIDRHNCDAKSKPSIAPFIKAVGEVREVNQLLGFSVYQVIGIAPSAKIE